MNIQKGRILNHSFSTINEKRKKNEKTLIKIEEKKKNKWLEGDI